MFDKEKVKFGIAPINWTNDDLPELGGELTYQQCLSEMALAGYEGSEIGNKYPSDRKVLKKALDLRGLIICNGWFSCEFTSKPKQETIDAFIEHRDFLYDMGARVIGMGEIGKTIHGDESTPLLTEAPKLTDEDFKKLASGLEELGKLAHEKGMEIAFHHHMGTGVESLEEIDRIMDMTDPDLVPLLFDTGHTTFAGEDAAEVLRKYVNRVSHVHFKDLRSDVLEKVKKDKLSFLEAVKEGIFTVPGDGDLVDWDEIFKILDENNYEGWIVVEAEQDPAKADPLEYAIKAREFMKEKTGI